MLDAGEAKVLGAIDRIIGSIARAREAAGIALQRLPPPVVRQEWSQERVVQSIRLLHIRGEPLASSRVPRALRDAAVAWCGSWQVAIEQAGLDYAATRVKPMPRMKRAVVRELRQLARTRPELTRGQLRRHEIGVAALRRYGSLEQALAAAHVEGWPRRRRSPSEPRRVRPRPPDDRRTLSRTETEAALRRRKNEGGSFVTSAIREDDPDLCNAIRRFFGGVNAARVFVGLAPVSERWTRERIATELRARHRAGRSIASEAIRRESPALHRAIIRKMGTVSKAVAALVPDAEDIPIDTARRVVGMIRLRKRQGKSLAKAEVSSRLRGAARRFFGTWQAALAAAGLIIEEELAHRTWTDDELMSALRSLAAERPAMTVSELHRSRIGSSSATRFGTLSNALRRAGLTRWPRRLRRPLPERGGVVRLLRQRASRGDALTMPATKRDEPRLLKAALKHYDTWRAALVAAGLGAADTAT